MKKRAFVWPGLILSLLIPLVTACAGGLPQKGSTSNPAVRPAGEELYVLDSYTRAGSKEVAQHIIALPVGATNPKARLMLPAGLTDLKHQRLYLANSLSDSNGSVHTTISVIDTSSGATVRTLNIPGSYSTADRGYADSMLSGDGRWLALRAQNTHEGATSIALVDTQAGKLVKSIHLNGEFTLDAVSPKGTMLYLLEYYQTGTSHYNVRAFDVNANQLLQDSIVDKNELGEKMQGAALARQVSEDGDMAYTLYINPVTNKAFIHILWLTDTAYSTINSSIPFPAIARCIDLPVGNSSALLHYYTLTLSQDGKTLYAANAALGTIAKVNLDLGLNTYQLWLIGNARIDHFNASNSVLTAADKARELHNGAAFSRDQKLLYVAGLHGIWVINTNTLQLQGEYLKQQAFTGLAMSSDGHTLYGVDPTNGITLLDSSSGETRTVIKGVVQAPWGIEWATEKAAQ
jgi:DNA-binding beta-propeller fold protein YncE